MVCTARKPHNVGAPHVAPLPGMGAVHKRKVKRTMATIFNNDTRIACNPLGIGRVVPGKCVHAALAIIGTGCTVADYEAGMAAWVAQHAAPHMALPGGGTARGLLRHLVDTTRKVVVVVAVPKPARKARKARVAKPASEPASEPSTASE